MKMNIRLEKLSDPKSPINWWHNWDWSPSLLSLFSALPILHWFDFLVY